MPAPANPIYELEDYETFPMYFVYEGYGSSIWPDGVVYIIYHSENYSQGIGRDMQPIWTNENFSVTDMRNQSWQRRQVSPLYALSLLTEVNEPTR